MEEQIKPQLESNTSPLPAEKETQPLVEPNRLGEESLAKAKKKNHFLPVLGIIFSLIALFSLANFVIPKFLVYLTKASRVGKHSLANSYVFVSPLTAAADGQQKIQVNVFLLDNEGRGVSNQKVSLSLAAKGGYLGTGLPQISEVQPMTNQYGQAIFELTSTVQGFFEVTAQIGRGEIPQKATVSFR